MEKLLQEARDALSVGINILPVVSKVKYPKGLDSWKDYMTRTSTENELRRWFTSGRFDGMAAVCGSISDNLECLDFDSGGECFAAWREKIPKYLIDNCYIQKTQSDGVHVFYRCMQSVPGSVKLASRMDGNKTKTLIETRGEGSIVLVSPSEGYSRTEGSLCDLPVIGDDERSLMIMAASEFNEVVKVDKKTQDVNTAFDGNRPGDCFNRDNDVLLPLLEYHGWVLAGETPDRYQLTRPGKDKGVSGTIHKAMNVFYNFSSSVTDFEECQAYSPFNVFATLEHGGDFSAAAVELLKRGYGKPERDEVDMSCLDTPKLRSEPSGITEDMLNCGGFLNDFTDYILRSSPYPNRKLAFTGAMCTLSVLMGRQWQTRSRITPNIYTVCLANTGWGKESPARFIRQLFEVLGKDLYIGAEFGSGEGLEDAIFQTPTMLFILDEVDSMIKRIRLSTDGSRDSIRKKMLDIYGKADQRYVLRALSQRRAQSVYRPFLTVWGSATPDQFYDSLAPSMSKDGFINRMMFVDCNQKRGRGQDPNIEPIPLALVNTARQWVKDDKEEIIEAAGMQRLDDSLDYDQINIMPYDSDLEGNVIKFQHAIDDLIDSPNTDTLAKNIHVRTHEKSMKLAMIAAASENPQDTVMRYKHLEWAHEVVKANAEQMIYYMRNKLSDNDHEKLIKKIVSFVKSENAAGKEVSKSNLTRKFQDRNFTQARDHALDAHMIEEVKRGRSTIYNFIQDAS